MDSVTRAPWRCRNGREDSCEWAGSGFPCLGRLGSGGVGGLSTPWRGRAC